MKKTLYYFALFLIAIFFITCDRELIRSGYPIVVTISAEEIEEVVIFTAEIQKYEKDIDEAGFIWQCNEDPAMEPGFITAVLNPSSGQVRAEASFSFSSEHNYSVRAYAISDSTLIIGEKIDFRTNLTKPCHLLKIEPASAYRGDTVKFLGKGFNMTLRHNKVYIGGLNSKIVDASYTELRCIVPLQATRGMNSVRIAVNGIEKDFGPMLTVLLPPPPTVITGDATNITPVSSTVTGSVNPNSLPGTVVFEYGTTTDYGNTVSANPNIVYGSTPISVTAQLRNLVPNTTYHYRIRAVSESGIGLGDDFTLTTPDAPPQPLINSLSGTNVKYGETLTISGYNFGSVTQILLGSETQHIVADPKSITNSSIELEIYNHQNPYQLLGFSGFRIGLVHSYGTVWSEQLNIITSWSRLADLPASGRYKAGCFTLNGKIYVGGGAEYGTVLKDFWEFDPESGTWSKMADIPGIPRVYPMGSASLTNGYMGAGFSADNSTKYQLYDFYKYNPQTDSWSPIPDYPDVINSFFFNYSVSVNGRPFTSLSNTVSQMREIVNDNWVSHPSVTDLMDSPANGVLVIGDSYYVITGYRTNGIVNKAVWQYNTITETWTRKQDFPGPPRHSPVFFSIGEFGYYGCGRTYNLEQYKDMYRYNPLDDSWIRIEDFPGGLRSHTISAFDGKYGYTGFGVRLDYETYFKDFWKFDVD